MGTPVRTLIRDAVVAAVSNAVAVPAIGGRVKLQRSHALPENDLDQGSWLVVRLGDEEIAEQPGWPRPRDIFMRMAIDVVAIARNAGDVDAAIDQIVMECRKAVYGDVTAGGNAKDIEYQGIANYGDDEENSDIATAPMRFVATYVTPENAPDTPL